jgi:histidyl-tRNA synthetase
MGAPSTPALGFAMGIERLLMVMENQGAEFKEDKKCDIYIACLGDSASFKATELCAALRSEGFMAETDICARGLKAQMRFANKKQAQFTVVIGDDEVTSGKAKLKNMANGEETEINLANICDELYKIKTEAYLTALENTDLGSDK